MDGCQWWSHVLWSGYRLELSFATSSGGTLGLELLLGRVPGHVVWWCCDAKKVSVPQRGFELLIEDFLWSEY